MSTTLLSSPTISSTTITPSITSSPTISSTTITPSATISEVKSDSTTETKKENKTMIYILIAILCIFIVGILMYFMFFSKNTPSPQPDNPPEQEPECQVSSWGIFSNCIDGKMNRSRTITKQGKNCPNLTEERDCQIPQCDIEWEEWTKCENGKKTRKGKSIKTSYCSNPPETSLNQEETCS